MIVSKYYYPLEWILYRYDFLFLIAVSFQLFLIIGKFENTKEVITIFVFHMVAMIMEIFKTHPAIGSWQYPELFQIGILGVPLFAGFMYSAVWSYIARVWTIFEFRFSHYPKKIYTILIAIGIYINFFTHHFIWDFRYILVLCTILVWWKTRIFYKPRKSYHSMNLLLWFFLVSLFIWIAENIGTYLRVWIYPSQSIHWHFVWFEKILAWFLLMIISFVLISLIHSPQKPKI